MKTKYIAMAALAAISLSSCNDWLKEEAPGTNKFDDFFTGGAVAIQTVNACYAHWPGNIIPAATSRNGT